MSQCIVPNWNVKHQRQEQVEGGDEIEGSARERINRSSHHVINHTITQQHQQQHNSSHLFPMSNYEVAELTWENGQLAMHGLGGLPSNPMTPTKPTWGRSNDTLESIVHQATSHNSKEISLNSLQHDQKSPPKMSSGVANSGVNWSGSSGQVPVGPGLLKKRTRADYDQCGRSFGGSMQEERADRSACASASATFYRDNDTTMMTRASYESPRSLKTKITTDEDSACHDGSDEDHETKMETGRSLSSQRSRSAAIHNQSERRRRDRINQKMKALQKLVPNANKADKASMLDEVIDYLKQLQAQVQMMSVRNMPQMNMNMNMMMPLGIQQHLQMSHLARMGTGIGLGMGMGMLDLNTMAAAARSTPQSLPPLMHLKAPVSATTPTFVLSPFMVPQGIATCPPAQANRDSGDTNASLSLPDPYYAFLAQTMNMDLYNKMAALYRQQVNQTTQQATSSRSTQSDHM